VQFAFVVAFGHQCWYIDDIGDNCFVNGGVQVKQEHQLSQMDITSDTAVNFWVNLNRPTGTEISNYLLLLSTSCC